MAILPGDELADASIFVKLVGRRRLPCLMLRSAIELPPHLRALTRFISLRCRITTPSPLRRQQPPRRATACYEQSVVGDAAADAARCHD